RAEIGISSPVLGLRPGRWFLRRRSKLPKPDSLTCCPRSSASLNASKKESTNSLASRLFKPTSSNRRSAISALVSAISAPVNRCVQRKSCPQARSAVPGQRLEGTGDGLIGVAVRQGAGNVLENQAHSQTL